MRSILITPAGRVRFVWDDVLAPLTLLGRTEIQRVSHVEPAGLSEPSTLNPQPSPAWTADMSPVGGPVLGPFPLHGEALAAERAWLHDNLGL